MTPTDLTFPKIEERIPALRALSETDLLRVQAAVNYAERAHGELNQLYGDGRPYIHHPVEVVELLATVTLDAELLAAGALHDVREDTNRTSAELRKVFGSAVTQLVSEVTNPEKPADLNRAERKAIDREHVAAASERGQTLKCADVACNINTGERNVATTRPAFARTYIPEKMLMLQELTKADARLRAIALARLEEGLAILESRPSKPRAARP